ncbi:MAG TPA: hypothetical protein VH134_14970 [Candidatus Dormibacteraeota bacterium]|nr:hypothetical protein [Candidatus Dormibacteraeota bacterium]
MATVTGERSGALRSATARPAEGAAAAAGPADWTLVVLCAWVVGGGYLDVWAHTHLRLFESFLTPWHAVLYSGMIATAAYLALLRRSRLGRGVAWDWTSGYGLSLTGCALFALSGVGDGVWHTLFGIETGINGLISPPHVLLTLSTGLIVSGPLRVAWREGRGRASWPAVISAGLLLSVLTYLTQFDHPLSNLWAAGSAPLNVLATPAREMQLGILGILVQTGLLAGLVLLLLAHLRLPVGSLTVILGLNGFLVTAVDHLGGLALLAVAMGALGDLLLWALRVTPAARGRLRLFAAVWSAGVYVVYFADLLASHGVWWPSHVWTGAIMLAAVEGWLISLLVAPPVPPAAAGQA